MKKYTKTKKINFFQVLKYIQTHFYYQKIYVAVDLQQGAKLRAWYKILVINYIVSRDLFIKIIAPNQISAQLVDPKHR